MELVYYPNEVLANICVEADFESIDIAKDAYQMFRIMKDNSGIGLAAPQAGLNYRMFIMEDLVIVNPTIKETSKEVIKEVEGCLSFPQLWMNVERAKTIVANFFDENGVEKTEEFSDIYSRCFLHEFDHLDGVCFNQRVSRMVFEIAKKKRKKERGRQN